MVKLAIWLIALVIIVLLAIDPGLRFRFEMCLGRRSMCLDALTFRGTCMVMVTRKQLAYVT